jgi:hypothetical protein
LQSSCDDFFHVLTRPFHAAATSGLMMMPAHFWQNTNFCPALENGRRFPTPEVDWPSIEVRAVPGIRTAAAAAAERNQ